MKISRNPLMTVCTLLLLTGAVCGQSLGDVARQQRAKQQTQPQPAKVLTNDDLPSGGKPGDDFDANPPAGRSNDSQRRYNNAQPGSNGNWKLPPEQWKTQISAMKANIASMQSQIDQMKSSVHFVAAPLYGNGVQHNLRQEQKLEQVDRMQAQLEGMKKQLEAAQEAARKQGFGSTVYDP